MVEDAGLATIGLHWLLAKTEGFYLTTPDADGPPQDGRLPVALAEATRDLGGTLMVFGSPKQRDLLPGVTYEQAIDYAARSLHARHARDRRDSGSTSAWSRWPPARPTSSTPAPRPTP